MTLAVHHLAVCVTDLDRAEKFYGGALGLTVLRRFSDERGQPRSIWFALAHDAFLAVEKVARANPRGGDQPGWHCAALAISLAEREPWRARLAAAGHPVLRETSYTLYSRDPDGNLVALSHYPEGCPTAPSQEES